MGPAERGLCRPSSARMERVRASKPPKRGLLFFGLRECIAAGAGGAEEEDGGSIGGLKVEAESSAGFKLAERRGEDWRSSLVSPSDKGQGARVSVVM